MKKYRLLKDTPTIKAGTIFQEVTSDYDKSRELVRIMPTSGTTSPQWTIDDINNFDEWFEEVREFEEWKLSYGEQYKFADDCGVPRVSSWCDLPGDDSRHSVGNCYPLDTPDELIIKEQKLIPQALYRLKMAAKKAWFEFDGSEGPDWKSAMQDKYYIYYGHSFTGEKAHIVDTHSVQVFGCVYFPTEESCQAYIDSNPEDMKLLFGVK